MVWPGGYKCGPVDLIKQKPYLNLIIDRAPIWSSPSVSAFLKFLAEELEIIKHGINLAVSDSNTEYLFLSRIPQIILRSSIKAENVDCEPGLQFHSSV